MSINIVTLNSFLSAFYPSEHEEIRLRLFKPKGAPAASNNGALTLCTTRAALSVDLKQQRELKQSNLTRGVYFVVNAGGDTDESITRFNAWFAEDDGRTPEEQHRILDSAPLSPSVRIETRKSVHAYWLIDGACGAEDWRDIQRRLIAYFGGDEKIKNPSRVMRLPFFNHVHYNEADGSLSYKRVELVEFEPERRYTLDEMRAAFPEVEQQSKSNPNSQADAQSKFVAWDDLNAELKRRLMKTAKQNRKGIFETRGICHNGKGETSLCFNPATGGVWCNNGCDMKAIYVAFGLPDRPDSATAGKGDKPKTPPRFSLTKLDNLLDEPREQVSFVWDRTLPSGGFSICGAKPKVGKSTLARNLAVAVARGTDFFGRVTHKSEVIYLCLEEKRPEVAEHFRRMDARGCGIHIHTGRAPDDALVALETVIDEIKPGLVVVDPLSRFVRVRDFNDYAEIARGLEPLIDLARNTGCHILAVHHCGKGERDGGDALLGSTALFGAVDALLIMKRREGARTLQTVQRYGEDMPETVAHLDAETGLVAAGGDLAALQVESRKREVLEAIGDEWLIEMDIRERVGGNQTLTARAIRALYESGTLARTGAGKRGDPYRYQRSDAVSEKSSILDSTDIDNLKNRENRESDEPGWLMDAEHIASEWMKGESDEVREHAAILEYYGCPSREAERVARESDALAA